VTDGAFLEGPNLLGRLTSLPGWLHAFEAYGPYRCGVPLGVLEVGALKARLVEVGPAQVRADQRRVLQDRPIQLGALQVGLGQVRAGQLCPLHPGLTQISVLQVAASQVDVAHYGTGKVGVPEVSVGEPGTTKEGAAQVDAGQIELQWIWQTSAQDPYRSLDIGSAVLQPMHPIIDHGRRVLRSIGCTHQPGHVVANERPKNRLDRSSVGRGVSGDALQGVDAAKPNVWIFAAQMVDSSGEPLGDLPLPADMDLPPRRDHACDKQRAGDGLQHGCAGVLLQLLLGLPQLDALLGAHDAFQLNGGQRRMQPSRNRENAQQHQYQRQAGRGSHGHTPHGSLSHPGLPLQRLPVHRRMRMSCRHRDWRFSHHAVRWVDGRPDSCFSRRPAPVSAPAKEGPGIRLGRRRMTGDHHDRDGIPLPNGPFEPAGGEVVDLHPATGRTRRPALPASELLVSSYGEVAAGVAAVGEPRWLIEGLWPADGVLAAQEKAGKTWAALDLAVSVASGRPWLDHDMGAVLQAIQGVCQHAGCALLVVTHWNKTGDGRGADRISGAGPAAWARVICPVSIHYRGSDPDGASPVVLGPS
jgi:AAA domain